MNGHYHAIYCFLWNYAPGYNCRGVMRPARSFLTCQSATDCASLSARCVVALLFYFDSSKSWIVCCDLARVVFQDLDR